MEGRGILDYESHLKTELENCKARCIELEYEVQNKKNLNGSYDEGEDRVFQLMVENEVLECEKKKAESEVEVWKIKFQEMESRVLELENKIGDLQESGNKMAPSTPGGININHDVPDYTMSHIPTLETFKKKLATSKDNLKNNGSVINNDLKSDENDMGFYAGSSPFTSTPKRKRASNIVFTDSETDDDDSVPISKIKTKCLCKLSSKLRSPSLSNLANEDVEDEMIESRVLELENDIRDTGKGIGDIQESGTPPTGVRFKQFTHVEGVRKQLSFEEGSGNKLAPSTPGVINLSDSQDVSDYTISHIPTLETFKNKLATSNDNLEKNGSVINNDLKIDENDMGFYFGSSPFTSTPKRKRASNIVFTDSETDDDNVPISKVKAKRLRKLSSKLRSPSPFNLTNEDVEDEMIEYMSDGEDESLGGFIDDSDIDGASGGLEDASDCDVDFVEIMSNIGSKRDHNLKWEFEADMLADFCQDAELCMRAVCALYRQQTSEERSSKGTIVFNQRGFSQCDAPRSTALAEFLIDDDPDDDLKKSTEELQVYNPEGVELCRKLAAHYSKQLFQMYKNKQDPLLLTFNFQG